MARTTGASSTVLTSLGVEPPSIDVWAFGIDDGSITEQYPRT
jgi:hypothetical protein